MGRKLHRQSSSSAGLSDSQITDNGSENRMKLTFNDIESTFKKFSGDGTINVRKWLDEFERAAAVFQWENMQKLIFCKRLLIGNAKLFVDCEVRPLTFFELKEELCKEFGQKATSAEIHKKLRDRKKRDNEGLLEYVYCMIDIAAQCDIDDNSVISYIIDGIRDSPANKTMLYGAKTISDFKEKLKVYEKFKAAYNFNDREYETKVKTKDKLTKRCYNCGSFEHEFHCCPRKSSGPKCFKCNNFGHKASNCKDQLLVRTTMNIKSNPNETFRPIKINEVLLGGLIDTGSYHCVIKQHLVNAIRPLNIEQNTKITVAGLVSNTVTKGTCTAKVEIDGNVFENVTFHIAETNPSAPDVIIGMDLLKNVKLIVDGGKLTIEAKQNTGDVIQPDTNNQSGCFLATIADVFEDNQCEELPDLSHLAAEPVSEEVKSFIRRYNPLAPAVSPIQLKIVPTDNNPVYQRPRRFPPVEQQIIDQQIEQWLQQGVIVPSTSNYASNVVLVKKKDGSHRLCVDFRALNRKTLREHFPLPVIEDQVDKLFEANRFTTLDLENAFFHVTIEEDSRKFTSFVTQHGQFEFVKVPFGLSNSPCVFQKYINFVLKDLIHKGVVIVYIDDIVIPSRSVEEGVARLKEVLQVAATNGLKVKWKKCQILKTRIEYLGICVENGHISPSPAKIKAVVNFETPTTMKKLQSFLGLANYFRRFIPNFAIKAKPLTDLSKKLQKNASCELGEIEVEAMNQLKQNLVSEPALKIFQYGVPTELHTDACKEGYGAILLQQGLEDKVLHPVYYFSRKTSKAEENYSSYELEVLAILQAVKKFRIYLIGQKFRIITDCKAFECTMRKKDLTTRVARWALLLEEFDYTLEHRSGSKMRHVDALSRNPVLCAVSQSTLLKKLGTAQQSDDRLNAIAEILKQKPYQDYVLCNGLLYKHVNNNLLIVVPEGMKNNIIKGVHDKGHFHFQKMKEIIEKEYYIDNLQHRINRHIANCIQCILSERKRGKSEGLLNPLPKGERPLEVLHIDHVGPMQATKKHYRYILAVIDGFTKFAWLFPTKTLGADEAIQKLEVIAETFGYPERMIADRGAAFTANTFKSYCSEHGVKLSHITVGVPRGNGQVERLHSVVIGALTKITIDEPEKWYCHVKPVQMIINSTFQRAIKMSPFKLLIGVEMRTNANSKLLEIIEEETINHFEESREILRESAKIKIAKIQNENKKYYDAKRKPAHKYKVGDIVAIEKVQFGVAQKIRSKFMGPYRITEVKGFDRYDVQKEGESVGPQKTNTSVDRMKPWQAANIDDIISEDDSDPEESLNLLRSRDEQDGRLWDA